MWRLGKRAKGVVVLSAVFAFGSASVAALGEPKRDEAPRRDEAVKIRDARLATPDTQQYCSNIAATAGAALNARQEKQLLDIEQQVARRLSELEAKRVELQEVLDRYDSLVKKADDSLVAIYGRMRPDSAAAQLSNMEEELAAALLMRLQPKQSSAILNDMEAARAAVLTRKIGGLATLAHAGRKP